MSRFVARTTIATFRRLLACCLLLGLSGSAFAASDTRIKYVDVWQYGEFVSVAWTQKCSNELFSSFPTTTLKCTDNQAATPPKSGSASISTSAIGTLATLKYQTGVSVICGQVSQGQPVHCWSHSYNGQSITTVTYQGIKADTDNDGFVDSYDNCPATGNSSQWNHDTDAQGDACDDDDDNDGLLDGSDNCTTIANVDQLNTDGDAYGNTCDGDDDNDGVADASDPFPLDGTESVDTDHDGIGNNTETDDDNDTVDDGADNCPLVSNANQLNTDGDAQGNVCDTDDDNDGVADASDVFPLDTDNDGIDNLTDNCVAVANTAQTDTDVDGAGDACDATPNGDTDNDGIDNLADNCPSISNIDQLNTDGDAQGNVCDNDDDNDGVPDVSDALPLDASESVDADGDGIGDNTDNCKAVANVDQLDTDADGQGDVCDVFPNDPTLLLQQDGTAKGEQLGRSVALADMDNDGIVDLLVGSPMANVLRNGAVLKKAGKIQIISGKNNVVIRTINGSVANQKLGAAIAVAPDQNQDGVRDIVVGNPLADVAVLMFNGIAVLMKDAGRVLLYSGSDGRMLRMLGEGNAAGDHFGSAVAVADVNGDNNPDLIVGASMSDAAAKDAGKVTVFNSISSKLLYTRNGSQMGEHFGAAIAAANGLLFIGAPQHDTAAIKNAGRVSVFSSSEGSSAVLLTVGGSAKGDSFGAAVTAANDDWVVGIPSTDSTGEDAGSVQVFSGLNPTPVTTLAGAMAGANFGRALNMQGDVNQDGKNDVAIGAAKFDASTTIDSKTVLLKDAGRVEVVSGSAL